MNFEFPPSYSRVLAESRKMASSQARRGSIEVDLGHATTTVEYRSCDNDVLIAGRYVRHRYMDPVKVEMRIRSDCEYEAEGGRGKG